MKNKSTELHSRDKHITKTAELSYHDIAEQYRIDGDTSELVARHDFDDPHPKSKFNRSNSFQRLVKNAVNLVNVQGRGEGCAFPQARVVYFLATGVDPLSRSGWYINHIDNDITNDRMTNLELVELGTPQSELESAPKNANGCGFRGIQFDSARTKQPYRARVRIAGKLMELGRFPKRIDAIAAIIANEQRLGITKTRRGEELALYNGAIEHMRAPKQETARKLPVKWNKSAAYEPESQSQSESSSESESEK